MAMPIFSDRPIDRMKLVCFFGLYYCSAWIGMPFFLDTILLINNNPKLRQQCVMSGNY
jgi:hypothetical protein